MWKLIRAWRKEIHILLIKQKDKREFTQYDTRFKIKSKGDVMHIKAGDWKQKSKGKENWRKMDFEISY